MILVNHCIIKGFTFQILSNTYITVTILTNTYTMNINEITLKTFTHWTELFYLTFNKAIYLNNTLSLFILQLTFNILDYISQVTWLQESTATVSTAYSSSRWFAPDLCRLSPLLLSRAQGKALLNVAGKHNCSFATLYLLHLSLQCKIQSGFQTQSDTTPNINITYNIIFSWDESLFFMLGGSSAMFHASYYTPLHFVVH